ncbi:MAG: cysteine-rich CWC family protein [Burkholderiaceae bacterium]
MQASDPAHPQRAPAGGQQSCPRCGSRFDCGAARGDCWCAAEPPVTTAERERWFASGQWWFAPVDAAAGQRCLCPACLRALCARAGATQAGTRPDKQAGEP